MQSCIVFVFVAASKGSCKDFAIYALKKNLPLPLKLCFLKTFYFTQK
jgi:hypothetical protein